MAIQLISNKSIIAKTDKKISPIVKKETSDATTVVHNHVVYQQPNNVDIYGDTIPVKAVEVDIDRKFSVSKVDTDNLKSDIVSNRVNNKVDKLRALRNGS